MKIILDNIIFFMQRSGGVSVYWAENVKRLDNKDIDIEYTEPAGQAVNIFYSDLKPTLKHPVRKENFGAKVLAFFNFTIKLNSKYIFHSSYYRVSTSAKATNVVTVLDFMPELFFKGFKRFHHSFRKKRAILKADGLICISENTRKDLLKYYPQVSKKPIVTIHLGVSDKYYPLANSEFKLNDIPEKYILFVGKRSGYKNFQFAVDVIRHLRDYMLVVIGERFTHDEESCLKCISNMYLLIKNPDNAIVNELYNRAFCLLYPSSYEGFGIPVIEAMKAGCPVVALNTSSIPEISSGAALLLDELDIETFAKAILSLENLEFRLDIINRGFNNSLKFKWDIAVNQLLDYYRALYSKSNH